MTSETSVKLLLNVAQRMQISCASSLNLESILSESLISARQRSHNTAQNDKTGLFLQLANASKAAIELRDACIGTGRVDLKESQRINETWNAIHEEQTRAWAEDALSRAHAAAGRISASASQSNKANRPVFNYEYTPLLEKYFQYNAYPSAPDRAVLARKCMMTPRQIEVWFQNHRNRAKKDKKSLRRLCEELLPAALSLESLEDSMPFFTIPKHERKAVKHADPKLDNCSDEEPAMETSNMTLQNTTTVDVLNPPRPSYAFPTVYTFNHDTNWSPTKAYNFSTPVWYRKPVSRSRIADIPINMQEFIVDFSQKLHLRAPVSLKHRTKANQSWCAGRVIVPPSAPLPSLLRSPQSIPRPVPSSSSPVVISSSTSHYRTHRSLSPSQPTTLVPSYTSDETSIRRKVACLPRRTPKSSSIAHRADSPAISDTSSPSSRSTSSSSHASSQTSSPSRSFSGSSSASSSPPSILATPMLSHSPLPQHVSPSISVFGVDRDGTNDLLNIRTPLSEDTMPFDTFTIPPKQAAFPTLLSVYHM